MKIHKLKIHNWRSIKNIDITFRDLMVFVGQNNHGKSNILSALLFFFGNIPCVDQDFNTDSEEAFIEVTFGSLGAEDNARFTKYLASDDTFTVRRQIQKGETAEYHGYIDTPTEDWLKEENISNYLSRESVEATPLGSLVPAGRLKKEDIHKAQTDYITANKDMLTFTREIEPSPFLGSKTLPQGVLGDIFYVPAVKNAADELNPKGKSIFNSLLANVINEMSASNPDYKSAKEQIKQLTSTLSKRLADGTPNTGRPDQISKLEALLEKELESWDTTIDIEITSPDIDEIMKVGTNVLLDDGVRTDINRKGNGLQRSLIFALVKAWARVSQEGKAKTTTGENTETGDEENKHTASTSTYFLFEEPELYLHPQAQRELFSSLKDLAENESQVFLTTHSSSFIDLYHYRSICVIYKKSIVEGTKRLQCLEDLFEGATEDIKKFNLTYWINPDRGELFFAKKVILVEGQTDKSAIAYIAKRMNCFRYDYTIVDCGCKTNIPLYIQLLNHFNLPYVAVYDRDHQANKSPDGIASADQASQQIETAVDSTYGSTMVFDNDIEEEIGLIDGSQKGNKAYNALEHIYALNRSYPESITKKIKTIYG
jgi:predicted ATP-dependent endonuclease of OLD family